MRIFSSLFLVVLFFSYSAAVSIESIKLNTVAVSAEANIYDGDTLRLNNIKYRLSGIDAPELEQTCKNANGAKYDCGIDSRNALRRFVKGKQVTCISSGKDRYKRELGTCYVDNIDVNAWMVEQGYAVAYRKYSQEYMDEEDLARELKKGIWQGDFIEPTKYRKIK